MTLPPAWFPLRHHPVQQRLYFGRERFVCVCAGRRSGKTMLARRRVVRFLSVKKPWPDPEYFYALPTYNQARRVAWEKIKPLVPPEWTDPSRGGKVDESRMTIRTVFGSTLRVFGLDKPMRAEGGDFDGGVIDESSDQRPRAFDLTFRPALALRDGWCWRIGVPKRFGSGAMEFRECYDEWLQQLGDGIHAAYTWSAEDIWPAAEVEQARSDMDARDFAEQVGGVWQTAGGLVYYCFDEVESVDAGIRYDASLPIAVCSDFNVDPMAWVLMQVSDNGMRVFDEVWERNTNTRRSLDVLFERYGEHAAGWFFFGDATGRARKTAASSSDYAQIRSDERFRNARCFYPKSNPAVHDRVAAVNSALLSADGVRRLKISPRCVHLIKDLGYLAYDGGTREIDDSDGDAKHVTDALGYGVHYLRPVRARAADDDEGAAGVMVGLGTHRLGR